MELQTLLKQHFGYDEFRPLQEEIVNTVLAQKDCLVLMPTGGGKSLCYQLPALALNGLTVVVSPLIALMKDQVDGLQENGVAAAFLNSTLSFAEMRDIQTAAARGEIKILYIAPERLAIPAFREWLHSLSVSLIAIDEAHCISEWGHDFRPDYRNLKSLRADFPAVPVIALTATATERVRADIITELGLGSARTFLSSFNRPNLTYHIRPKQQAFDALCELLEKYRGEPVIIYCFSRKGAEGLAADLQAEKFGALAYHAGLERQTRKAVQDKFIRDEAPIIVATIAFGMGIDKPDIRLVVHYDLPKTIEGYYQETGRAGRDNLPADCVLFYSYGDVRKHNFFIDQIADETERGRAQEKLGQVIEYCELSSCRREYLLRYFGEQFTGESCAKCDLCLMPRDTFDATEIAQKILSAVLRTGSRYGANYVIEVLRGSRSAAIRERGHEKLSVFGIVGREFTKVQLREIVRGLVRKGLLLKEEGEYPIVAVSSSGKQWLRDRAALTLPRPPREREVFAVDTAAGAYEEGLFERLRALRKRLADQRRVPPFVIFGNASLIEMSTYLPQSRDGFLRIGGVGQEKLARYGEPFMAVIRSYAADKGLAESSAPRPPRRRSADERAVGREGSTYEETKVLIEQGLSIAEAAARRSLSPATVIGHLEKIVQSGKTLRMDHLKPAPERLAVIASAFQKIGKPELTPVKELLGDDYSYDELHVARMFLLQEPD